MDVLVPQYRKNSDAQRKVEREKVTAADDYRDRAAQALMEGKKAPADPMPKLEAREKELRTEADVILTALRKNADEIEALIHRERENYHAQNLVLQDARARDSDKFEVEARRDAAFEAAEGHVEDTDLIANRPIGDVADRAVADHVDPRRHGGAKARLASVAPVGGYVGVYLGEFGLANDPAAGRRGRSQRVEAREDPVVTTVAPRRLVSSSRGSRRDRERREDRRGEREHRQELHAARPQDQATHTDVPLRRF